MINGDEREGVSRGVFELDPTVMSTDIFLLTGQQSSRECVSKGAFELDHVVLPANIFLLAG
ncbi:hypothetical protein MTR_6g086330 [Medicago truncatula]|uniref:Uncharacterized protein n=1 Tax=Medicago truncatula TaxID=3880 RepID=G7KNI5_MEDTR|nr:hypothetical protein MTR_6g086330 [Medicago truncatula]